MVAVAASVFGGPLEGVFPRIASIVNCISVVVVSVLSRGSTVSTLVVNWSDQRLVVRCKLWVVVESVEAALVGCREEQTVS